MGTNYYLRSEACPRCGRSDDELHIGKSSAGWCFTLHVIPERNINTLDDWRREWSKAGTSIRDEYGTAVTVSEMEAVITKRGDNREIERTPYGYSSWDEFHRMNHSAPGPNGPVRHALGDHCVGHGEGTWDYIPGEFS